MNDDEYNINKPLLYSDLSHKQIRQKLIEAEGDISCLNIYFDRLGVPTGDIFGKFSLVGRIKWILEDSHTLKSFLIKNRFKK